MKDKRAVAELPDSSALARPWQSIVTSDNWVPSITQMEPYFSLSNFSGTPVAPKAVASSEALSLSDQTKIALLIFSCSRSGLMFGNWAVVP